MKSFGYYIIKSLTWPISHLPLGFHRKNGAFLGWMTRSVLHYRTDVVMTNLSRSFPDKKYDELREISRKFYRHFGMLLGEVIWFGSSNYRKLKKNGIVEVDNPEVLNKYCKEGRSVFVLTSHRGNWELIGGMKAYGVKEEILYPEYDICVVYKELTSKPWDEFMFQNRTTPVTDRKKYDGIVESFSIMRYAFHHKNTPKHYYFITDQYPYSDSSKVKVDNFLHQTTYTMNGGAALAKVFGMAVLYMDMTCDENGNYKIHYTPITENAANEDLDEIMNKYYALLQKDLEREPWNYLWTHKRWK